MRLRFGVAGLGVAGARRLPVLARSARARVTAAADVRTEALERFERDFDGETYVSVEDLCKSSQVDAVWIATPTHLHREHVVLAAEHGKQVILEKPMALTIEDCEAMNAAVDRSGVRFVAGHANSLDPPLRRMRELVRDGELGPLLMINTWAFNEFMYLPKFAWELDPARGGGAVFNQGPHQADIVRLVGGGLVRSVRAAVGTVDPSRGAEGSYSAWLQFEDGTPATMVYNGYGHFDSAELHYWLSGTGRHREPRTHVRARQWLSEIGPHGENAFKEATRYGGARAAEDYLALRRSEEASTDVRQPFFGLTIASCERGDLRQSSDGLYIYDASGRREIRLAPWAGSHEEAELNELYEAMIEDRPVIHDGRWGEASLELCLAIRESARQGLEVQLSHQVASRI